VVARTATVSAAALTREAAPLTGQAADPANRLGWRPGSFRYISFARILLPAFVADANSRQR
jgi:hypothetical protein